MINSHIIVGNSIYSFSLDVSSELINKNSDYGGFKEVLPVFPYQKDLEHHYGLELKPMEEDSISIIELSKDIGKGLFSTQDLAKGSFLVYFGELVDKTSKSNISMTFGHDLYVDCSRYRSKAYYINHGCEPNCIFEEM